MPFAAVATPGARDVAATTAERATSGTSSSFNFNRTEPDKDQDKWESYAHAPAKYKPLAEMTGAIVRTNFKAKRVVIRVKMADVLKKTKKHSTSVGLVADGDLQLDVGQYPRYAGLYSRGHRLCDKGVRDSWSSRVDFKFDAAKDVVRVSFPVSCLPKNRMKLRNIWLRSASWYDNPDIPKNMSSQTGTDNHFPDEGATLIVRR